MDTIIYYFTGTGNSLKIAKDLAAAIKGTQLIQISHGNINQKVNHDGIKRIGFVFPVYYFGMPQMVKAFVEGITLDSKSYIFAAATCGGSVGIAMNQLQQILTQKGVVLSAAFKILMPDNFQVLYGPQPEAKQQECFRIQEKEIKLIADQINGCEVVPFNERGKYFTKVFGSMIYLTFKPKEKDKRFWVEDTCNGCSVCSRVCSANNIQMKENQPVWQHQCEFCLACMQWCPQRAIQYNKGTIKRGRYHHPEIKVQELFQDPSI